MIHGVDEDETSVGAAGSSQMRRQHLRRNHLMQRSPQFRSIDGLKPRPGPVVHGARHDIVAHAEEPCGWSYLSCIEQLRVVVLW